MCIQVDDWAGRGVSKWCQINIILLMPQISTVHFICMRASNHQIVAAMMLCLRQRRDLDAHSLLNIKRHQNTSDDQNTDTSALYFFSSSLALKCIWCTAVGCMILWRQEMCRWRCLWAKPSDPHHTAILLSGLWPHDAGLWCHDSKNSSAVIIITFFFFYYVGLTCSYTVSRHTGFHLFFSISGTQNPHFRRNALSQL